MMSEEEAVAKAKNIYTNFFDEVVSYPEVLKAIAVGVLKGADLGYSKALEDITAKVKVHGLISSEVGYSDILDYESRRISEDVLWDRFEDNAQRELSMVIANMR